MAAWITSSKVRDMSITSEEYSHHAYHTGDTGLHSWEVLVEILKSPEAYGIVCDIGMFVSLCPCHIGLSLKIPFVGR